MKNIIQENTESSDYKDIKFKELRKYAYDLIRSSDLSKVKKEDKKDKIQDLIASNGGDIFSGRMFYLVLKELDRDINIACEDLFHDYTYPGLRSPTENLTQFAKFISGISLTDGEIAFAIGASGSRISRIRHANDETDFYPYQVYALAKISQIKPSQLFDYFYGDGERPVIGLS
ncbi:MAG: hypothetical protein LBF27_23525 [Sphingobacterium sp.]|jgi:hypothetical protein|nr:hypothetical protein [Sphingobacterium sp.]